MPATLEHHYVFNGWTPEIVSVTTNAAYTATFAAVLNQYTITFDTDGGSEIDPIKLEYGADVPALDVPIKTGYNFTGWDIAIPETMPAEDLTLKAQWEIKTFTVSFFGTVDDIEPQTVEYGNKAEKPEDPEIEGYAFLGWFNGQAEYDFDKAVTEDLLLVAKWGKTYSITYILNGGINSENNPETASSGQTVVLENATREYYEFAGWYTDEQFTGEALTEIEAGNKHDVTLFAKWTDTVTFISTLNLADYTGIYVYIHLPADEDPEEYTVNTVANKTIFAQAEKTENLADLRTSKRARGDEKNVLFYRVDAIHAASPEMTDEVTVTLLKNGEEVEAHTYSVKGITDERLASGTLDDVTEKVHKALLQYGHYAEILFADGAKMEVPSGAPALTAIPGSYQATGDPTNFKKYITKFDARAELASAIGMNVYLTPAKGYTLDDFEITVTDRDGKAYTNVTKPEMSGKRIRVKIGGVLSPQMGRDFHITVTLKNDSTKTATWTRSIITCAYEIQKGNAAGSSACNMAQALYQYYLAAADVWPNMK